MDILVKNIVIESVDLKESDIAEKYVKMKEEADE